MSAPTVFDALVADFEPKPGFDSPHNELVALRLRNGLRRLGLDPDMSVDRLRALVAEPPARQAVIDAAIATFGGLAPGEPPFPPNVKGLRAAVAALRAGRDTPTPDTPPTGCPNCDGSGVASNGMLDCARCNGTGVVPVQVPTPEPPTPKATS